MTHRLDQAIERRWTDSSKWREFPEDVLPLTGAELEFAAPAPVLSALRERLSHPVFGYSAEPDGLRDSVVAHLRKSFGWTVETDSLVFLPSVVTGLNVVCRALASQGDEVIVEPPVYTPILEAPSHWQLRRIDVPLVQEADGSYVHDFDALAEAFADRTRMFMLCNPQNPVGRAFRGDELERIADLCERHDVTICSDEIYGDWVFPGNRHIPIASLGPDVARRSVTFIGTAKSHNIPGVKCAVAIIPDGERRSMMQAAAKGIVPEVGVLEYAAARAAYEEGGPWLHDVKRYLEANRDYLFEYVKTDMRGIQMNKPEGTPAAWLDCRGAGMPTGPYEFFLSRARVALNDGAPYGAGGEGFVRLAYGCPRSLLRRALDRMKAALEALR